MEPEMMETIIKILPKLDWQKPCTGGVVAVVLFAIWYIKRQKKE